MFSSLVPSLAPELQVSHWFNSPQRISLAELLGRVVFIEAFQMLCPGCVVHGLPQAVRVAETFSRDDVVVLGLHTVFEHHDVQGTPEALAAFLHEYHISFPVGIDQPAEDGRLPRTMAAYGMQGTPTALLVDRNGRLRKQMFGPPSDLALGADIMALLAETACELSSRCVKQPVQIEPHPLSCAARHYDPAPTTRTQRAPQTE